MRGGADSPVDLKCQEKLSGERFPVMFPHVRNLRSFFRKDILVNEADEWKRSGAHDESRTLVK